ncbi:hypothetical protein K2P97_12730 [bacterium]|nr:hypothetical protein [bacterium]
MAILKKKRYRWGIILFFLILSQPTYAETINRSVFCAGTNPSVVGTELVTKLKTQKISYSGSKIQWALLNYISNIFEEFKISGPVALFFKNEPGPKKLSRTDTPSGPVIFVTADAEDMLFGPQLAKYRLQACSDKAPKGDIQFVVSFSNTVFEQLLRALANKDQVSAHLTKKTGWQILNVSSPIERPFRLEELITIEKQIIDIPPDVFKKLQIKQLARQQYGAKLPIETASAMYFVKEQKILFADSAFIDNVEIYGEGTVLHEMGHAYWYGQQESFKDEFIDISWKKFAGSHVLKNKFSTGFVSEYAMKSPEEDFAEHFSAFINQPEWLKTKAPSKFAFFKKQIFPDVEYFTNSAANAKIYVESENPDTKPPWLGRDLKSLFTQKSTADDKTQSPYKVSLRIDDARDDISGFDKILVTLEHIEDSNSKVFFNLAPTGADNTNTPLEGETEVDPDKIPDGAYHVSTIALTDRAKNTTYYKTNDIPNIYLKGNLGAKKRTKPYIDLAKIKINPQPAYEGHQGVEIVIPTPHQQGLNSVHLNWDIKAMDHPTVNVCAGHSTQNCFLSSPGDPEIKIRSYFWKEYAAGTINLTHLTFIYDADKVYGKETFRFPITQQIGFSHNTGRSKASLLDLNVNQMKLAVEKGQNKNGGDTSINFSLPITEVEYDDYNIMVAIMNPSGKRILHIATKNNSKIVAGNIVFNFPLFINQEQGEYIIESFEVKTEFKRPQSIAILMDLGHAANIKIKLKERGIRKTFRIKDDRSVVLP